MNAFRPESAPNRAEIRLKAGLMARRQAGWVR